VEPGFQRVKHAMETACVALRTRNDDDINAALSAMLAESTEEWTAKMAVYPRHFTRDLLLTVLR
jgi:hypothetical protein